MKSVKVGDVIVGDDGRFGVVTEVREDCFFARPASSKYRERVSVPGVGDVVTIMATPFFPRPGGRYEGYWADGRLNSVVFATLAR